MRGALLPALAISCAALAAAYSARASEPSCAVPDVAGDWEVSTPEAAGIDGAALCAALSATREDLHLHSVLVVRRGRLVAELYRSGPDRPIDVLYGLWNPFASDVAFAATTLHDVRSVSKTVVGMLYGIALAEGRVPPPSAPALDAFPELASLRVAGRDAITIGHLLSMSSGLRWDEGALPNDETSLYWKRDPVRFLFDRPVDTPPGAAFLYDSGGTAALAEILTRALGKPVDALARERILDPLGVREWEWVHDLQGRPLAFTGLRLRPRDMAKLGRLALQKGRWESEQLVPEAWIAESMRAHLATGIGELGYGYQWWTGRAAWKGGRASWSAAFGNGGQRVFVVPELDLVVVTTAGDYGSPPAARAVLALFESIVAAVAE